MAASFKLLRLFPEGFCALLMKKKVLGRFPCGLAWLLPRRFPDAPVGKKAEQNLLGTFPEESCTELHLSAVTMMWQ